MTEPCQVAVDFATALTEKFTSPEHMFANHFHKITVMGGKNYDRLVCQGWMPKYQDEPMGNEGRSCYAFVERATGLLVKSGGWVGPAKGKNGLLSKYDLSDPKQFEQAVKDADPFGRFLYTR